MTDKPKLAVVETLYTSSLRDVPEVLRTIADQIEAGEMGVVRQCAIVVLGSTLQVYAAGDCDSTDAHYLLCCGARKLEQTTVDFGEDL